MTTQSRNEPEIPPETPRVVSKPAHSTRRVAVDDEVARRRRERAEILRKADERLHLVTERVFFEIPRAYPALTGSLCAAAALYIIERWSGHWQMEHGTPWVRLEDDQQWLNNSGLSYDEWLQARLVLRELGMISERRYFNTGTQSLMTEFRFNADIFGRHLADYRAEIQKWFLEEAARERKLARASRQTAKSKSSQ